MEVVRAKVRNSPPFFSFYQDLPVLHLHRSSHITLPNRSTTFRVPDCAQQSIFLAALNTYATPIFVCILGHFYGGIP